MNNSFQVTLAEPMLHWIEAETRAGGHATAADYVRHVLEAEHRRIVAPDQLAARAAEAGRVNQRLQEMYQRLDQELELARRLQESFLPQSLPNLPCVRF